MLKSSSQNRKSTWASSRLKNAAKRPQRFLIKTTIAHCFSRVTFQCRYLHLHYCFHDWKKWNHIAVVSNDYKLFLNCHESKLKSMQYLHLPKKKNRGVQKNTQKFLQNIPNSTQSINSIATGRSPYTIRRRPSTAAAASHHIKPII